MLFDPLRPFVPGAEKGDFELNQDIDARAANVGILQDLQKVRAPQ